MRQIEKERIKFVDLVNHSSPLAIGLAFSVWIRIEKRSDVPTLNGHLGDTIDARRKIAPERFEIRSARQSARHSDDGDRRAVIRRYRSCLGRWHLEIPLVGTRCLGLRQINANRSR